MAFPHPPGIVTPVGDIPPVVLVAFVAGIGALFTAVFLPHYRRIRMQQRIRKLPPPPIKKEVEPDLKLPRRGGGTES